MLAESASLLNINVVILDSGDYTPAKQIVVPSSADKAHIDGSFTDPVKIRELAKKVDVLTVEIEHVGVQVLEELESGVPLGIHPSPSTIRTIQDKFVQKQHLQANGAPVSEFISVERSVDSIQGAISKLGLPLMLKSRTLAYDGRGNFVIRDSSQIEEALTALKERPLYAEKWVPFVQEIAVMVVRNTSGEIVSYPAVETIHKDNICHLVFAPLRSRDSTVPQRARQVAEAAVKTFQGAGIFGVEMFLMTDGMYIPLMLNNIYSLFFVPRNNLPERDSTPTTQLRTLHHRSMRNLSIREPPPSNPLPSSRVHRPQSPFLGHAQHPRSLIRNQRSHRLRSIRYHHSRRHRPFVRKSRMSKRQKNGPYHHSG